jgi:hypothetical protein
MKPLGLSLGFDGSGLRMGVRTPSKVEDAVWEAVTLAIESGWSPQQFKNEVADAWRERLHDEAKDAVEVLSR